MMNSYETNPSAWPWGHPGPGLGLGISHSALVFQGFFASLSFCDDLVSAELEYASTPSRGGPQPTPEPVAPQPPSPQRDGKAFG